MAPVPDQLEAGESGTIPLWIASENGHEACVRLLREAVVQSDVLLLLQSARVCERPWCLVELMTAIEHGIPIVGAALTLVIVLPIVGCLLVALLVALVVYCCCCCKKAAAGAPAPPTAVESTKTAV